MSSGLSIELLKCDWDENTVDDNPHVVSVEKNHFVHDAAIQIIRPVIGCQNETTLDLFTAIVLEVWHFTLQ